MKYFFQNSKNVSKRERERGRTFREGERGERGGEREIIMAFTVMETL